MRGSIRQIVLFDVADEIRLDALRAALGISESERKPAFSRPAPDYVRFERPPVIEPLQIERFEARAKYYDYGVVSVELDQQFSLDWPELVEHSATVLSDPTVEQRAMDLLKPRLEKARAAVVNPYPTWLDEDYVIINVVPETPTESAADLLAQHGREIAQIVRGENRALSDSEFREILEATISLITRTIFSLLAGRPRSCLIIRWRRDQRFNCWNTRTRSYSNSVTTTNY